MHNLSKAIFVLLLSAVYCAILPQTLYQQIASVSDEQYKCPYLRETLLKPEKFDFLESCRYTDKVRTADEQLCLLYYNNFMELCYYSTRIPINMLLNASTVNASIVQSDINQTCAFLNKSNASLEGIKRTVEGIIGKLQKNHFCENVCVDLENHVTPICIISGLMRNISIQISRQPVPKAFAKQNATKPISDSPKKTQTENTPKPKVEEKAEGPQKGAMPETVKTIQVADITEKPQEEAATEPPKGALGALPQNAAPAAEQPKGALGAPPQNGAPAAEPPLEAKPEPKTLQVAEGASREKSEEKVAVVEPPEKKPVEEKPAAVDSKAPEEDKKPEEPARGDSDVGQEKPYASEEEMDDLNIHRDDEDIQIEEMEKEKVKESAKPKNTIEVHPGIASANDENADDENSFFFFYFMMVCAVFIIGYIGYHNKQKVLALVIEGRRGRRSSRRAGRPNSANYHKLDSNLEEAVTSGVQKNTTNVIY